ncbi:MAG: DUF362 domain-containing protein [Deltaproteobacteria bacterium]|nr:MAG: DUF362 domain-containing protein [Deltaproteobacteria bacterium]
MKFTSFYRIQQNFDVTSIDDVAQAVRDEFARFTPRTRIRPGQTVAVGVGSRGTHDLKVLVKTTVECLRSMQLEPYVIPAMGSHGGATGEGQAQVLTELGITEKSVGAPIVSNMDTVSLGRVESGAEVFFAKDALAANHIVVINRVKPHTAFRSEVESGLCKILAVGCGRQKGAANMHKYDLGKTIIPAANLIKQKASVLCGLAVTENALGGTHSIKLARPDEFARLDREFLKTAWKLLPRIPIDDLDVLLVDEMGKNVSGAGMDPNVIGFWRREGGERKPDYRILIVLDLTPHSHGNATGIGMADLTTRRVIDKIDWDATYLNAFTSGVLRSAHIPIPLENDRAAVETAFSRLPDPANARMVRIVNTSELETFWATEAVLPELHANKNVFVDNRPLKLSFDDSGKVLPMES